jgi:hypothetical protein
MNAITFVGEIIGMVIYDDDHFFVTPLEKLEDAKCVIRSSKSKTDEQCNDQKKKEKDRRTNNDLQNTLRVHINTGPLSINIREYRKGNNQKWKSRKHGSII